MNEFAIIIALLVFIIVREILHTTLVNKLVDKLMSRNFYDYKVSEAVGAELNNKKVGVVNQPQQFQTMQHDPEFEQALGSLTNLV